MTSTVACLVGGPQDGRLIHLQSPMLQFRIPKPVGRVGWNDLEDLSDLPLTPTTGMYRRGRTGRDVTFYDWTGWE